MAALLVAMSVMAILLGAALPVWSTYARREKEAELIFRGEQYARAIALFQRKYANVNPPTVDVLLKERFLRKKYKDPITGEDFELVTPTTALPGRDTPAQLQGRGSANAGRGRASGPSSASPRTTGRSAADTRSRTTGGRGGTQAGATGGIMGVMSKSTEKSFRVYNGAEHYNEWIFMPTAASSRAGAPSGADAPGVSAPEPAGRGRGRAGTPSRAGGAGRGRTGTGRSSGFAPSR
jgi:type II secretory pathway pseudopilin PulG